MNTELVNVCDLCSVTVDTRRCDDCTGKADLWLDGLTLVSPTVPLADAPTLPTEPLPAVERTPSPVERIDVGNDAVTLWHGDCLDALAMMPDASVDAIVTDPPYGLEFMGKEWDGADGFRRSLNAADVERNNPFGRASRTSPEYRAGQTFGLWCLAWATECLRVLKPGGHLLAFGGTRTSHRLVCAVEDAGFEIRDSIAWLYGSGFPKSLDVSKAINKAAGATRSEIVGTPDAERWQGWGTALKPAHEPIVVARKPFAATVAANVLAHGTGALNVDGCRVEGGARPLIVSKSEASTGILGDGLNGSSHGGSTTAGRWPANVILDESQAEALDQQSGEASRFFYVAKAPKKERPIIDSVAHPTVKPLALMRWLVRLVTPLGGTVLDPFVGSGATVEACLLERLACIAIEKTPEYLPLVQARVDRAQVNP